MYPRIGVEIKRPNGESAASDSKRHPVGYLKGESPCFPITMGPCNFGGHHAKSEWNYTGSNAKPSNSGSMEFYANSSGYFIFPTRANDSLCNMQIYTRKGSGVKLTVWNASNRSIDVTRSWQPGKGISFKSRQRSADMLVKVQQKPVLTGDTDYKHPELDYQIDGTRLSDMRRTGSTTTQKEQKALLQRINQNADHSIRCVRSNGNKQVQIGFWWDPKVLGTPAESGPKYGLSIEQYGA